MTTQTEPTMPAGTRPAVTIVVPGYGVADLLPDALGSLLAQNRPDWAAIVVDDGDRRVGTRIGPFLADPRIRLLETDNGGPNVARNRGIAAAANTPYIVLLDGDDMLEPAYLTKMIAALESAPDIGFVSADATYFGLDRVGERFSAYCRQDLPATLERVIRRDFNIFVAVTMRREAIDAIGGFDPDLRSSEDLDAWIRLLAAGWRLAYVPQPLVRYRRRRGQASGNRLAMLNSARAVMMKAEALLAGRPEQVAAVDARRQVEHEIAVEESFARIAGGEVRRGVAELVGLGVAARSPRWRRALLIMRTAPLVAPWLLKLRSRL